MSTIEEYLKLFLESDEIIFEEMPEGFRVGNGKKVDYLKKRGYVSSADSHEGEYPIEAWLLPPGEEIVKKLRKSRKSDQV